LFLAEKFFTAFSGIPGLWEAFLRGGSFYKGKAKARQGSKIKARSKQRHKEKGQRQAKEEGRTKAKGALLQEASREVFKELQGIREGLLL
jgi:hypothetical protein